VDLELSMLLLPAEPKPGELEVGIAGEVEIVGKADLGSMHGRGEARRYTIRRSR
jgi:hypothetical protein